MAYSLGRTLAVRFALTMGAALALMALWAYRGVTVIMHDSLDRSLEATYEIQSGVVAVHGDFAPLRPIDERHFVEQVNRMVVGWDASGRMEQVNLELARDLALDSAAFRRALEGVRTSADGKWRGHDIRVLYGPAPPGAGAIAVIEIAAFREPMDAAALQVLLRMGSVALLGVLASFVGAVWLIRSALDPVETIARQASAIHGGRTGQRITAHAEVLELRSLIQVLNEMLARLERSYEWHREIIRDLGHDLRTPLATMRAAVEVALWTERRPEQYRAALASTLEEIDRLTLISDALSLLAKLESGDLKPVLATMDVRTVANQAVDRARERVGGHEIRFTPPAEALPATLDARLLGMVLDQLLDNARRHTPPGTRVNVTVGAQDSRVRLTVEDEGPGVPEEMMGRLFNHFYRVDPARGRQASLGLGLTLAASIVDLHGGLITAERHSPHGLRIRIELPREPLIEPGSSGHQ
jgi:signal transduction histidine kinase